MPIDLVIDERDTKSGDLGDNNNNSSSNGSGGPAGTGIGGGTSNGGGRGGSADIGHHSDSASTPDHQVTENHTRNHRLNHQQTRCFSAIGSQQSHNSYGPGPHDDVRSPTGSTGTPGPLSQQPSSQQSTDNNSEAGEL